MMNVSLPSGTALSPATGHPGLSTRPAGTCNHDARNDAHNHERGHSRQCNRRYVVRVKQQDERRPPYEVVYVWFMGCDVLT